MEDLIFPTVKAGAVYEGKYLLGTSFARPVIAKRLVEIAKKEGADACLLYTSPLQDAANQCFDKKQHTSSASF